MCSTSNSNSNNRGGINADDSSKVVEKWSTSLLAELKKDLVTIHSDLQRAVAFKMQVHI